MQDEDGRGGRRYGTRWQVVVCRPEENGPDADDGDGRREAGLMNLSLKGLQFQCAAEYQVDDILDVTIKIPGPDPVQFQARVLWTRPRRGWDPYFGAVIAHIDEENRVALSEALLHARREEY